jgi:hypothetical protein
MESTTVEAPRHNQATAKLGDLAVFIPMPAPMDFGSEELQRHNQATANVGDVVVLGPMAKADLERVGVVISSATLAYRQSDGAWFVDVDDVRWCIGSGYDWKVQ